MITVKLNDGTEIKYDNFDEIDNHEKIIYIAFYGS